MVHQASSVFSGHALHVFRQMPCLRKAVRPPTRPIQITGRQTRLYTFFRRQKPAEDTINIHIKKSSIFTNRNGRVIRGIPSKLLKLYLVYLIYKNIQQYRDEQTKVGRPQMPKPKALNPITPPSVGSRDTEGGDLDDFDPPDVLPDDAFFFPIWYPTPRQMDPYDQNDPEWQAYVQFAHDPKRMERSQHQLVERIVKLLGENAQARQLLGDVIRASRIWLDYSYPNKPPTEYVRLGLEFTDTYVAITRRPVDTADKDRIDKYFWPRTTLLALWDSCKLFCYLQTIKYKYMWEDEIATTQTTQEVMERNLAKQLLCGTYNAEELARLDHNSHEHTPSPAPFFAPIGLKATTQAEIKEPADQQNPSATPRILNLLPTFYPGGAELALAVAQFKQSFTHRWGSSFPFRRGNIYISGLIEVEGSKGRMSFDVKAFYNPSTASIEAMQSIARGTTHTPIVHGKR